MNISFTFSLTFIEIQTQWATCKTREALEIYFFNNSDLDTTRGCTMQCQKNIFTKYTTEIIACYKLSLFEYYTTCLWTCLFVYSIPSAHINGVMLGCFNNWATSWKNLFMPYVNNKGADQPANPRSLISAFIVRCLDSIIYLVSIFAISRL